MKHLMSIQRRRYCDPKYISTSYTPEIFCLAHAIRRPNIQEGCGSDHAPNKLNVVAGPGCRESKKGSIARNVSVFLFLFFILFFSYELFAGWSDFPLRSPFQTSHISTTSKPLPSPPPLPSSELITNSPLTSYPLQCTTKGTDQSCPHNYPTNYVSTNPVPPLTCPDYFHWIHEDLRPWKETGVTRQMVEAARKTAHFRLVILEGRVYVEKYRESIQTRDEFTLWGILQLLRRYPGRLPDLELMFDCDDRPVIPAKYFKRPNSGPPPLFKYCSDPWSLDLVFPDWSFWGWAECNIKPWRNTSSDIQDGSKVMKWKDRVPLAYWRGNPNVAPGGLTYSSATLLTLLIGTFASILRYKIYIEGWAWSVSEKYILGCDSMTLVVKPTYHDFFNRGMLPLVHYWPIKNNNDKCKSLKFAVEWVNNHTDKAQEIGQAASRYIHEDMKIDYVYDYMFYLLCEYAKLLRFKPAIPPKAVEPCSEAMACEAEGNWRKFMEESLEESPSNGVPCTMPPPYDPLGLRGLFEKKAILTRQVEIWEDEYWKILNPKRKR